MRTNLLYSVANVELCVRIVHGRDADVDPNLMYVSMDALHLYRLPRALVCHFPGATISSNTCIYCNFTALVVQFCGAKFLCHRTGTSKNSPCCGKSTSRAQRQYQVPSTFHWR